MAGEKPLEPGQLRAIKRAMQRVVDRYNGSQTEAAKHVGISQGHVSAVLGESRGVGLTTAIRLASELDTTVDAILGLAEDPDDPALAAALASESWAAWQVEAALSRRNLHGKLSADQWVAWLRALATADAVATGASRQEQEYEARRARAKRAKRRT